MTRHDKDGSEDNDDIGPRADAAPYGRGRTAPKPGAAPPAVRKTGYRRVIDYPRSGRHGWRALVPSWRLVSGSVTGGLIVLAGLVAVVYATTRIPDVGKLSMPTATVYEYSDGTPFFTAGLQDRVIVPIGHVPAMTQHAVVAIENPTFYTDPGISVRGIGRALVNDANGRPLQGGSTITQQFVKNAYLTDAQTFARKISEIFIAVKITRVYPKRQILGDYLNTVYFGRGSYGIDAAAETYFGVPVGRITDPGRAAYLAALINEPAVLSRADPASQTLLRQRWNLVLDEMVKTGYLTRARREAVTWPAALPLGTGIKRDANGVDDSAMAQAADGYLDELHARDPAVPDSATAEAGGDVIVTTFSQADMKAAVRTVNDTLYRRLHENDPQQAGADRGVQAGLATVGLASGELLAIYPGSSDYDNATQAQIEPGSQMQAFAVAAHLPQPGLANPRPPGLWTLMSRVGLTQNLVANPAELPEPLPKLENDPALALGIAPESPARMAAAFAIFDDGGVYHDLAMALSVTVNGHKVWTYVPHGSQVMSPFLAPKLPGLLPDLAPPTVADVNARVLLEANGIAGTIGGDDSAWYTGAGAGVVTSVGLWDTTTAGGRVVMRSLAGLGGIPAALSPTWPHGVWASYMSVIAGSSSAQPGLSWPVPVASGAAAQRAG